MKQKIQVLFMLRLISSTSFPNQDVATANQTKRIITLSTQINKMFWDIFMQDFCKVYL